MSALVPVVTARLDPTREALVGHLTATGMAGPVATPRENNLLHYRLLADRDPYYLLGLDPARHWTRDSVLELMARKVGVSPLLNHRSGQDTIDPERTADALDRYAARFGVALRERQRVLFATGHPGNLGPLYRRFAAVLRAAGGIVVEAARGWSYDASSPRGRRRFEIGYTDGVAVVEEDPRGPVHSHAARPIRAVLTELAARREPLPDLVVADHGWCGGAAQAGVDAIGFADCNDPALFVGEDEGTVQVAVPLDDGLEPERYTLLGDYVLARAQYVAAGRR
ncbi:phosphatase [Actinocrinis puniceicyclus]|uniref:Phosphatase n=1 Tax=Actinocrinis puniceicyclus TaxID=977794 RepID=A0A8J7WMD6_9ACTN|nr:phosphatase [Actinocrinis puniceicyclus]MBS2965053.1 phosphatase [Actinocrinis puniceicyclus]